MIAIAGAVGDGGGDVRAVEGPVADEAVFERGAVGEIDGAGGEFHRAALVQL